jgi:hypothetical protein
MAIPRFLYYGGSKNRIFNIWLEFCLPTFVVCIFTVYDSCVSMYRPSQMKPRLHFSVASFVV